MQMELASEAGISLRYLAAIEGGASRRASGACLPLSQVLGV